MIPIRTFIVEDNPVILKNLSETLEELTDVRVVGSAVDEDSAVRRLRAQEGDVDLVIVDMFLKSGSGMGVLRAAQNASSDARRVVLSNYTTTEMRHRCRTLGAERVFDKSGEIENLIDYCATLSA